MSTEAIIWGLIFAVVGAGVGAVWGYVLGIPKIKPVGNKGWIDPAKRVSNSPEKMYPTTDTVQDEDDWSEHDILGITIANRRWFLLPAVEARITSTRMTVWNSRMEILRADLLCRYTTRSYAGDPLFAGYEPIRDKLTRKETTLGDGDLLHIVVAARNIKTNRYNLFTWQTDSFKWFPPAVEALHEPPPYFIMLAVSGNKFNTRIYLKLETAGYVTKPQLTVIQQIPLLLYRLFGHRERSREG